jgi:SAM-dependent methyltransferase
MRFAQQARNLLGFVARGDWRTIFYRLQVRWRRLDLEIVDPETLGLSRDRAKAYMNSGGPALTDALKNLSITASDSVLDIGCGKGGAMLTLARYPFSRVDGLELSPELVRIGSENLTRAGFRKGKILEGDAAEFRDLDGYTFFYLYNPFPEPVLALALNNIVDSQRRVPRKITLIYMTPVGHSVVQGAGFREVQRIEHAERPIAIYVRSESAAACS